MKKSTLYDSFMEEMKEMPVVDTHEHLMPEKMRLEGKIDFFNIVLCHYASSDLISAGMSEDQMKILRDDQTPLPEKIKIFMPYWSRTANTTYCRALEIAARELYGIDSIDPDTLPVLNSRMVESNKPGLYKKVLQDQLHIQYCLWDQWWVEKPLKDDFFRLSLRLDEAVFINDAADIQRLETKYGISIQTPNELEEIMEISITANKTRGLTALKSGLAYCRTLDYEPVSRTEATLAMDKILRGRFTDADAKTLQDYMMYSLAEKAYWHDLPMQIHTGMLEGNGNFIDHANPSLLSHLIKNNPNTRFDLFHGGYPFGGQTSAIAKMFPNVYLNMAWVHLISPRYSRGYLSEWLDAVPVCKILGFGGDYIFVEGVYGHLQMAKANIAHVMAEKVEDGLFSEKEARGYIRKILHGNGEELYSKK